MTQFDNYQTTFCGTAFDFFVFYLHGMHGCAWIFAQDGWRDTFGFTFATTFGWRRVGIVVIIITTT